VESFSFTGHVSSLYAPVPAHWCPFNIDTSLSHNNCTRISHACFAQCAVCSLKDICEQALIRGHGLKFVGRMCLCDPEVTPSFTQCLKCYHCACVCLYSCSLLLQPRPRTRTFLETQAQTTSHQWTRPRRESHRCASSCFFCRYKEVFVQCGFYAAVSCVHLKESCT